MKTLKDNAPELLTLRTEEKNLERLLNGRAPLQQELAQATEQYLGTKQSTRQSKLETEAAALIGDTSEMIDGDPDKRAREIQTIEHELAVYDCAIQRQRQAVAQARSEFSVALCQANRGTYVEIQKKIAAAVKALAEANELEVKFFQELEDAGCSSINFRPMRVSSIGLASDPQGRAAFHRKELAEYCPEALS